MMTLRVFNFFFVTFFVLFSHTLAAQHIKGKVLSFASGKPLSEVEIFDKISQKQTTTDNLGFFEFVDLQKGKHSLVFYNEYYDLLEKEITVPSSKEDLVIFLKLTTHLSEVIIQAKRSSFFDLRKLKDVESTAIYAGKKNEVILVNQIVGNLSANNTRQIYAQVSGLNIYESANCGLQLAIGGRGLNPNRTSNFNTRQNGYDISADVLGYPESYFTPPAESLQEIQIIRGAASLQYGTQFGGLLNFKIKKPSKKKTSLISRQTYNSNCGYATFNSFGGTYKKLGYYSYFGYKKNSQGPRPNTKLEATNAYINLIYHFSKKTKLSWEYTHLNYVAQQPGGLTDAQFYKKPYFSNRTRNWFKVNWNLFALKLDHIASSKTRFSLVFFGLDASRAAIGFRTNRVSQEDDLDAPRGLIFSDFRNWGAEFRMLKRYQILQKKAVFVLGGKYYHSNNSAIQGPGSNSSKANFDLATKDFPNFPRQSNFKFPNLNFAVFGENIYYVSKEISITPGFRIEYIKTESKGRYKSIDFDLAGNPIRNVDFNDNRVLERTRLLLGIGLSLKPHDNMEIFANVSQNYRSVTFNDIRIINPTFQIDPNISDEKGFSTDLGMRGNYLGLLSYDISGFGLLYNDRIGEVLKLETVINPDNSLIKTGKIIRFRGNIGSAFIYGIESLLDWNILKTFGKSFLDYKLSVYTNIALTSSQYLKSKINGVKGNSVEFVPNHNFKTGIKLGYRNFLATLQYTYLSEQFTDASNAPQNKSDNQNGVFGTIPSYQILDVSLSFSYNFLKLEAGINNLLNRYYFTQRASGYPGPGIIPALPRSIYTTFQIKF